LWVATAGFKRAGRSSTSSDAIVVLKADHKEIRGLFREFRAAGEKAVKKKSKIVGQIIELLTVHTYIENEVMYPRFAHCSPTSRTTCWSPTKNITLPTSCAWS
jgi:hemerythrin superfamily protein